MALDVFIIFICLPDDKEKQTGDDTTTPPNQEDQEAAPKDSSDEEEQDVDAALKVSRVLHLLSEIVTVYKVHKMLLYTDP